MAGLADEPETVDARWPSVLAAGERRTDQVVCDLGADERRRLDLIEVCGVVAVDANLEQVSVRRNLGLLVVPGKRAGEAP